MKRIFLLTALSVFILGAFAQETQSTKYKFYGFVRNDFYYNSRSNEQSSDGLYHFYPKPVSLNSEGQDINAQPNSEMLSIYSRLGLDVSLPDFHGAKVNARIESDFAGTSTNFYLVRIRQAFINFSTDKSSILVGQTWHPLFSSLCPTVISANTGSPFQPFNRSPQIQFKSKLSNKLNILASALYQMQYSSFGPIGCSNIYMKNSNVPNLFGSIEFADKATKVGVAVDFKRIMPSTGSYLNSASAMFYAGTKIGDLQIKAKTIYGENLSDQIMIGGYAVSSVNADGTTTYTNLNTIHSWVNLTYGNEIQFSVFGGMSNQLGTNKTLDPSLTVYGRGYYASTKENMKNLYRLAPSVSYNYKYLKFGLEYDYTAAEYGNMQTSGDITDTYLVGNHRIAVLIMCTF